MPSDLTHGRPVQQSVARATRWPAGVLALTLAALAVLWLHALALQGLAQALPGLGNGAHAPRVSRAFITRTVQFDNGADKAPAPATTPPAAAPPPAPQAMRKPAGASLLMPPEAPVPMAAQPAPLDLAVAPTPGPEPAPQDNVALTDAARTPAVSAPAPADTASAPEAAVTVNPAAGALPSASARPSPRTPSLAAAGSPEAPALPVYDYRFPGSTRLKYEVSGLVKGFGYRVSGELLWLQDGKTYDARLEISHFLLGSRLQTSKGALTPRGLEPLRFGDKVRSEVAAHFQRAKGLVTFSANTPDTPLMPLAQDQLSIFVQLAAMWGANPGRFAPGMQLPFQAVGPRTSENWTFLVGTPERLKIDGRELPATKLLRERSGDFDTRVELWLAPALDYLPARIRLTQSNGDEVDMLWSRSEKP
jgi:hypothetical protein